MDVRYIFFCINEMPLHTTNVQRAGLNVIMSSYINVVTNFYEKVRGIDQQVTLNLLEMKYKI